MIYDRLIKLVTNNNLYKSGERFAMNNFKQALKEDGLLDEFNDIYLTDLNCSGDWLMWDFSDRFARFAKVLCSIGYCKKIDNGLYQKI